MGFLTLLKLFGQYLPLIAKNLPLLLQMMGIAKELVHFLKEQNDKELRKETICEIKQGIAEARTENNPARIEKVFSRERVKPGL